MKQLQVELIDDTAVQLTTVRSNERLTTTLTDTMHEDTQVKNERTFILQLIFVFSIFFVYLVFHMLLVQLRPKHNVLI